MQKPQDHQRTAVAGKGVNDAQRVDPGRRAPFGRIAAIMGAFLSGLILGAAVMHYGLERPALDAAQARIAQYKHDLDAVRGRLDEAVIKSAALEGRLFVEESTRRALETSLGQVQTELGQARDTIAFYEQLMPPGPNGAVSIRALDVERAEPHLRYRMLLMRSGSNDKPFRGELQFVAAGVKDGEKAEVVLEPPVMADDRLGRKSEASPDDSDSQGAAAEPSSEGLALEFSEFQRSSGLLALPDGFVPESVTVNILEGRTLRVSRKVDLSNGE